MSIHPKWIGISFAVGAGAAFIAWLLGFQP